MKTSVKAAVFVLLSIFVIQGVWAIADKSPTADELAHHVASGYSYLLTGDFRMNPASPPVPRMLAAFPLLFLKARAPLDHPSWKEGNSPVFAHQFFYVYNKDADQLIFWARIPILFLSALFGLAVFLWSRKLFGDAGGLAGLCLYVFCPDILAHSSLGTADLSVGFFSFLTFVAFWAYLKEPLLKRALWTGAAAGLAFLSKFTAVLLFPILLLVLLVSGKIKSVRFWHVPVLLTTCFLTVWAGYFFEIKPLLKNTPDSPKKIAFLKKIGGERLVRFSEKTPIPLSTFTSAVGSMVFTRAKGTHAYLLGEWSGKGWWYYYFIAFFVKNTIPFLLFGLLGLVFIRRLGADRLTLATLLGPLLFFFLVTMPDRAQAGIRYFLPVYPLWIALGAGATAYFWKKGGLSRICAVVLLLWHAASALLVGPHYLAYFNEIAGGPEGGRRILRDSNIDWGQDLKGLARVVKEANYPRVVLFYAWPADPGYYKIPYRKIKDEELLKPENEVYAVAVHRMDRAVWTKGLKPDRTVGHSILIYDLRSSK